MRSAIICIGFTLPIRTRGLILAFGAGLLRCSQTVAAKSNCSTRYYSQCPARRSSIMAMRSAWVTIITWAIATDAAPRCNGAPTATPDSQEQTRSSFICRSRSIRNIITKPSTLRTSRKISPRCCGGYAESLQCGKISRRSRAALSNFSTRTTRKFWRSFAVGKTRP